MYRNNSISRNFEDVLIKNHIPYKIYGALSFFSRKEIKDMEQSDEVRYYVMGRNTYAYIEGYGMYTILTVYTLKGNVLIECSESGSHIDSDELLKYANNILK